MGASSPLTYSASADSFIRVYNLNSTGNYERFFDIVANSQNGGSTSSNIRFLTSQNSGAPTEKMRVNPTGRVGIGTTAPAYKLTVSGSDVATGLLVKNTSSSNYPSIVSENDLGVQSTFYTGRSGHSGVGGKTSISNSAGGAILLDPFNTGSNVGINSQTPQSRLSVNGGVSVGSYANATAAPSDGIIVSGNVGIGTTTPTAKLDVNGNARFTGTVTMTQAQGDILMGEFGE